MVTKLSDQELLRDLARAHENHDTEVASQLRAIALWMDDRGSTDNVIRIRWNDHWYELVVPDRARNMSDYLQQQFINALGFFHGPMVRLNTRVARLQWLVGSIIGDTTGIDQLLGPRVGWREELERILSDKE